MEFTRSNLAPPTGFIVENNAFKTRTVPQDIKITHPHCFLVKRDFFFFQARNKLHIFFYFFITAILQTSAQFT